MNKLHRQILKRARDKERKTLDDLMVAEADFEEAGEAHERAKASLGRAEAKYLKKKRRKKP